MRTRKDCAVGRRSTEASSSHLEDDARRDTKSSILLGAVFGSIVALLGAWKDTQWEPFRWQSFFKTPILTVSWAFVLSRRYPRVPWVLLSLSAVALERLTVETWKGLLRRPPSKFRRRRHSRVRDTQWLRLRLRRLFRSIQLRPARSGQNARREGGSTWTDGQSPNPSIADSPDGYPLDDDGPPPAEERPQ